MVINGLVAVALPPGLEPDGQLRLYYDDESHGSYQFMYSKDLPPLDRLAGLAGALEQAQGKDPKTVFGGLSEISRALDPSVEPRGPTDSRVIGGNSSYAVSGVPWLIPCNVYFKAVVNPFDLEDGLSREAKLRVSVPLKVTGAPAQPRIVVYAGGLSTAAVKMELPADAIPPTALPLAPLPEPAPAAAQPGAPAGGASVAPQRDTGARPAGRADTGRSDPDGRGAPVRRPEGADEEPQPPAPPEQAGAQGAAPAPPPRIPVIRTPTSGWPGKRNSTSAPWLRLKRRPARARARQRVARPPQSWRRLAARAPARLAAVQHPCRLSHRHPRLRRNKARERVLVAASCRHRRPSRSVKLPRLKPPQRPLQARVVRPRRSRTARKCAK